MRQTSSSDLKRVISALRALAFAHKAFDCDKSPSPLGEADGSQDRLYVQSLTAAKSAEKTAEFISKSAKFLAA